MKHKFKPYTTNERTGKEVYKCENCHMKTMNPMQSECKPSPYKIQAKPHYLFNKN